MEQINLVKVKLRKISPFSFANFSAVIGFCFFFIIALIIVGIFFLLVSQGRMEKNPTEVLPLIFVVLSPFLFAFISYILGLIFAALTNLFLHFSDGLTTYLEEVA